MAHEKQYWKDALQTAKPEGSGSNNSFDKEQQKKQSRLMYSKRILQRDIKQLLNKKIIRYSDIIRIHNRHGIQVT